MANPVYSQAFVEYTDDTPNVSFEVPAGYVAVVRQASAAQNFGGWVYGVYIQSSAEAPRLQIIVAGQVGDFNYVAQEGRWVVDEGGIISISVSELGTGSSFYVGGYLIAKSYSR